MAGASDALRLIVSADTAGAVREFDKLGKGIKSSVGEVDKQAAGLKGALTKAFDGLQSKSSTVSGLFDKLGVSSGQAASAISAAIPAAAVAAGGALVAFAIKGVQAFQETALAAGKFADSTGLSVDAASRYIAVADDIGVGADTIQNAFIKMEKAMGSNRAAFSGFIATAKGGGTDLSQTFLNAITHLQGIQDPIQRATESSKLFGKGFAQVSELINTDAGQIADSLGKVSDAQIITPAELEKARDYRAAMDDLKDSVRDVQREVGEQLVPTLTDLASFAAKTITITVAFAVKGADILEETNKKTGGFLNPIVEAVTKTINPIETAKQAYNAFLEVTKDMGLGNEKTASSFDALVTKSQQMGAAIGPAGTSFGDFTRLSSAAAKVNNEFAKSGGSIGQAMHEEAIRLGEANAALQTHTNLVLEAAGGALAVSASQREFNQAVTDGNTVLADSSATTDEKAAALDRETAAALGTAQATVDYAKKQADATGATFTAKDATDTQIATLYTLASKASPAVQTALGEIITKLQTTDQTNADPDVTLNDQASTPIGNVSGAIDVLDQKEAVVTVGANTSSANANLTALRDRLNAASAQGAIPGGPYSFAHGGMVPGPKGAAQAAIVHGGEYVLSEDIVNRIKNGKQSSGANMGPGPLSAGSGAGGNVVQITINGAVDPYNTARQIQTILAKGGYAGFSAKAA